MELMMERTKQAATLEGQMNGYWKDRSESYSAQNLGQFFGEKRAAWEEKLFGNWTQGRSLRVLDIGTGPGFFAILAALRGHKVTAVDMSQEMLQKAQANVRMTGVSIQLQQVGNRLPFAQESFDLIVSRDVTWTLTEPEEQLQHWASLLAPGGEMLYFDAEWYAYLRTEAHRKEYERKKREIREKGGFLDCPGRRGNAGSRSVLFTRGGLVLSEGRRYERGIYEGTILGPGSRFASFRHSAFKGTAWISGGE